MPGALPERRRRRLAARPSTPRGNAVNSYCMVQLLCLRPAARNLMAAGRSSAMATPRPRHNSGADAGKALNYMWKRCPAATRLEPTRKALLGKKRAYRFLVGDTRHRLGKQLRAGERADALAGQ